MGHHLASLEDNKEINPEQILGGYRRVKLASASRMTFATLEMNRTRQYGMSVALSILLISALLGVFLWADHIVNTRFDGGHADNIPHIITVLYFTLFMPAALLTQLTSMPVGLFLFWIPAAIMFGWLRVKLNAWKAAAISCTAIVAAGIAMNIALMALAD